MSSTVYLKFDVPIKKEEFLKFCTKNKIEYSPETIGGNVFYYEGFKGVEISFGKSGKITPNEAHKITVSTFHISVGGKMAPVAQIAKDILARFPGTCNADIELQSLMGLN